MHRVYECGPAANMPVTCITSSTVRLVAARRLTCTGYNSVADRDEEWGARAPTSATHGRIRTNLSGPGRRLDITAAASTRGPAAIATTRWVNSMSGLSCHCGAIWSGRQPGQVGQEAPDPVAHTTAPIATARKVNSAARRNTVSTAVGGAEAFLGMEVSPGDQDSGRRCALDTLRIRQGPFL